MKKRVLTWLLAACALFVLLPCPAAAAEVQIELGTHGSYGVHIPFTPSKRTELYTFSILQDGAEVFRAKVTASGGQTDIYLPFEYNPAGGQYTLRVTAHAMPGREGLDREASMDKPFSPEPTCGCPAGTAGVFYLGKGTAADPYRVASAAQLQHINNLNHLGKGQYFLQVKDIDVEAEQGDSRWTPIGNSTTRFYGTYDGGGHWVRNLRIDGPDSSALFGYVEKALIQRLAIETPYVFISSGPGTNLGPFSGGIVGDGRPGVTLSQCYANVSVTASSGHSGLLCGLVQSGSLVTDCYGYGKAAAANQSGLIQNLVGSATRCYGVCAISGAPATYVGGIVGCTNTESALTDCRWFDGPSNAYGGEAPKAVNLLRYPLTDANLSNPANFPASFGLSQADGLWEMGDVWYYNHKDGKPGERVHVVAPKLKIFTYRE